MGEQLPSLAQREHDPVLLVEAHLALGVPLFFRGEFDSGPRAFGAGHVPSTIQQHRSHASCTGKTLESIASPCGRGLCGFLAIQTRP